MEKHYTNRPIPHPFFAIAWRGTWWPFFASICFTRGVIFALPQPLNHGVKPANIRFMAHLALSILGFILYTWSLAHQAPTGLPPIHHWWAKVFMFFNLCMLGIHLLPLPNLLFGEWLIAKKDKPNWLHLYSQKITHQHGLYLVTLLAASPIIDLSIGAWVTFPIYQQLASLATQL